MMGLGFGFAWEFLLDYHLILLILLWAELSFFHIQQLHVYILSIFSYGLLSLLRALQSSFLALSFTVLSRSFFLSERLLPKMFLIFMRYRPSFLRCSLLLVIIFFLTFVLRHLLLEFSFRRLSPFSLLMKLNRHWDFS